MLEIIRRNAVRLSRLSNDILDVAKIESKSLILEIERVDLNELIGDAIAEYESQIKKLNEVKVNLNVNFESNRNRDCERDDDIFVNADRSRLSQVLDNFLSNAIKFTKRGSITVCSTIIRKCSDDDKSDTARKSRIEEEGEVIVSVKDTGIGIEPGIFFKLFDKFTTRSYQGTGLGLFISKSIIEAHGGKIWAENNIVGKGATFSFSLPRTK
jgi:signal transduction histidine kinase